MRHLTQALLDAARNEKDVENAYRGEIGHHRPDVGITSPFGSDGYAQWRDVRALLEFKYDLALKQHRDQCGVLGQMILYLKKFEQAGQVMPNVLFVGDKNECFALEVGAVKHFLALPIDWSAAPSAGEPALTRALLDGLAISPFVFDVGCDFRDVLDKIEILAKGEVHRVKATQANIGAMFTFWEDNVFLPTSGLTSTEQVDVFLRCLFKPDDVVAHGANKNILVVEGRKIPINGHQWQSFINHFVRGYKPSEIEGFYASKDRLVEDDSRRRQGAFFTPTLWVAEAHKMLDAELGANWRETCIVWDPACGTGNLTRDYNFGSLILSTLEQSDVDVIREQGYNPGANLFRYDFLNDDSSPFFTETNTLPDSVDKMLREAAKAGKRLVFLMNPPYAEHSNAGATGTSKAGIALTAVNLQMTGAKMGLSSRQLYAQFMYQSAKIAEVYGFKKVTVALYSKPTFMCSGSYRPFRNFWYGKFHYRSGMLFQASHFADVSGRWGVSFTLWSEGTTDSKGDLPIELKDVRNFEVIRTGIKPFYNSDKREASAWVREPTKGLKGVDAPQMSSGLKIRLDGDKTLVQGATLNFNCHANNLMKSGTDVFLTSSCSTGNAGVSVLPGESFRRATALYAARKLVIGDWINDKDEYLAPGTKLSDYEQWNDDAVIYALLHTSNNCTAMRNVQYKGRKDWRIRNHFFWHSRAEARVLYDTPSCGTLYRDVLGDSTDPYLAEILPALMLSPEAQECLTLLDTLLVTSLPQRESFATSRPELHLMAWDAGVYQLKNLWRETDPNGWKSLQVAFKALSDKLRPGVFEFGFLRQ